jgi:hypothetical protein
MIGQNIFQTSSNLFNQAAQGPNINQFMNPELGRAPNINQFMNPELGRAPNINQFMNPELGRAPNINQFIDPSLARGPNINQFMNQYTRGVTDNAMADLERQRQMQINATSAAASRAGAFGGSRHGVAEAQTNLGFGQQGAQLFGNLQQQGFNTALQAAQEQQRMQQQGFNTALGAAQTQQQFGQQGFNTALQAAQEQQRMQSGLAGQGFGFGQSITEQQTQQGAQQQALNQALINAARNQYQGFTGAPQSSLDTILGAMGAMPNQSTQTQTQRPGAFNWLGLLGAL